MCIGMIPDITQSGCVNCPGGHNCADPRQPATACSSGTFSLEGINTECTICPEGLYIFNKICILCSSSKTLEFIFRFYFDRAYNYYRVQNFVWLCYQVYTLIKFYLFMPCTMVGSGPVAEATGITSVKCAYSITTYRRSGNFHIPFILRKKCPHV